LWRHVGFSSCFLLALLSIMSCFHSVCDFFLLTRIAYSLNW
jgi:hypothetical protein